MCCRIDLHANSCDRSGKTSKASRRGQLVTLGASREMFPPSRADALVHFDKCKNAALPFLDLGCLDNLTNTRPFPTIDRAHPRTAARPHLTISSFPSRQPHLRALPAAIPCLRHAHWGSPMAVLKSDSSLLELDAIPERARQTPLARVMREFEELVLSYQTGLLLSLEDTDGEETQDQRREKIRHEACRLAISELSATYTRKQIRRSLQAAESLGKRAEERLHTSADTSPIERESSLGSIEDGHFRLYSTDLFEMLGQPADLRFGTLRFHASSAPASDAQDEEPIRTSVELALNSSFFVADSTETLPYHSFSMPNAPSLMNRGILSRKPEDGGAFPVYDSWLLFTFLGNGCLKVEIPIEMCADVYGGNLRGRENEEIVFWGIFVEDEAID